MKARTEIKCAASEYDILKIMPGINTEYLWLDIVMGHDEDSPSIKLDVKSAKKLKKLLKQFIKTSEWI